MTAIVLPDIDLDELRKSVPSLAEIDIPSLGKAGRRADDAIDRWRGRTQGPSWPWIAAGIFTLGLIATLVALVTWSRRDNGYSEAEIRTTIDTIDMPGGDAMDSGSIGESLTGGSSSIGSTDYGLGTPTETTPA